MIVCNICNKELETNREFGYHIQFTHKVLSEEYTIKHYYNGVRPSCHYEGCNNETRYIRGSFSFNEYCKEHAKEAMKKGGEKGGRAEAWNKGLTKESDKRVAKASEKFQGEKNPFYGRKHTQETINKIISKKRISEEDYNKRLLLRLTELKIITPYFDYVSRQHQYLDIVCMKCSFEFKRTLQAFERGCLCPKCFPFTTSKNEIEIVEFIKSLNLDVIQNDRHLISPLEVDIHIPSKSFAIEYNSLYWHSELNISDKRYHKQKTLNCHLKNVQLMHIFSDEWENKKDLIKSMIKNRLKISQMRIGARQCLVNEIDIDISKEFFEKNHIAGSSRALARFGLIYKDEVCACLSVRKPSTKGKSETELEIARFASKRDCMVMGGFSKLIKFVKSWAKQNGFTKISTYADLRFGEGKVYEKNGFVFIKDTGLDYWYTDGVVRYSRQKFKAQKGKSEADVAQEAGVYKIWGCGSNLYEMEI